MIQRRCVLDGQTWTVSLAGRSTVYERDEFPVVFERKDAHGRRERRVARFSPQGSRQRAAALGELTDGELTVLFAQSQTDDLSPELDYARG